MPLTNTEEDYFCPSCKGLYAICACGWTYFVALDEPFGLGQFVKIGQTQSLVRRIKELSRAQALGHLKLLGAAHSINPRSLEKGFHDRFHGARRKGTEWFAMHDRWEELRDCLIDMGTRHPTYHELMGLHPDKTVLAESLNPFDFEDRQQAALCMKILMERQLKYGGPLRALEKPNPYDESAFNYPEWFIAPRNTSVPRYFLSNARAWKGDVARFRLGVYWLVGKG